MCGIVVLVDPLHLLSSTVRTRLRERELAGDQRAGIYARALARREQYRFVRRNWRHLTLMAILPLGLGVLALSFVPAGQFRAFCGGLVVAGVVGALAFWVAQATGTGSTMMGDFAEQWTAAELRKLRGRGWRVVNHVKLRHGDIDHVLIGPGGVFAVETKWSADPWEIGAHGARVVKAAQQASNNARDLRLWLKKYGVPTVHPVVFLWGAADVTGVDRVWCYETTVLHGHAADSWRSSLIDEGVSDEVLNKVWAKLDRQVRVRDGHEANSDRVPPSPFAYTLIGLVTFLASVAAVLAVSEAISHTKNYFVWFAAFLAALLVGMIGLRLGRLRLIALGWLAGVAFSLLVLIGMYVNAVR